MKNIINKLLFVFIISLCIIHLHHSLGLAGSISIRWTGNSEPDLDGYYLYYGTSSGNYGPPVDIESDVTTYEIEGLDGGRQYFIALSAYDDSNNESVKCQEISGIARSDTTTSITTTTTAIISITPGIPTTIEAEEMSYHANGSPVQTYWLLWSNGIMSDEVYFPSSNTYRFEITAKGTLAHNIGPEMELLIDGQVAGTVYVNTITPDTFVFDVVISEGVHTVAIGFYNDYSDPATNIDRNLYVDKTIIMSGAATTTTTAPTTTATVSPGTTTTPAPTTAPGSTTTSTPGGITPLLPPITTTIQTDKIPPSGSITINNDETVTSSREVFLSLFAVDNHTTPVNTSPTPGGDELVAGAVMSFSNDGVKWSSPESYRQTKEWTLEPGNGEKTVYAQFRDDAGNWMVTPAEDRILLEESLSSCVDPRKLQPLSARASSASPLFSTENLIDGNPSTMWSALFSLFKKEEFITLDLGTVKKISGLSMYGAQLFGVDFFPTNFKIQISKDNTTFQDIKSEAGYSFAQAPSSDSWDMSGFECRYIRISITRAKTLFFFFQLAQIAEIEVYGCDSGQEPSQFVSEQGSIEPKNNTNLAKKKSGAVSSPLYENVPSIPGKPVIRFIE